MNKPKSLLITTILMVLVLSFMGTASGDVPTGKLPDFKPVAEEMIGPSGITWVPKISFAQLALRVARPDGTIFSKNFAGGTKPYLDLSDLYGDNSSDGTYTYELRVTLVSDKKVHIGDSYGIAGKQSRRQKPLTQTGYFRVQGGMIVANRAPEGLDRTSDIVHSDDVIINGGLCVGFDCVNGELFKTIMKLKGNTLRIYFEDTSSSPNPTNDWRISINDFYNGGADYFSIEDSETWNRLFILEAGAPDNSLYVDRWGWVGLGTSVPWGNLHIVDGDVPDVWFHQDGSNPGYPEYIWSMYGWHDGFGIIDVTSWSRPFFIEAGCPYDTLNLKSNGKVGIGTPLPDYRMELETTGVNAEFASTRTDGATCYISGGYSRGFFGTKTDHPLRLVINDSWIMELTRDPDPLIDYILRMENGAKCSKGGVWTNASSIAFKENIQTLTANEAVDTLNRLSPVKFNYKTDKTEKYVGFIAEHVPDLVATKDRKGLSPMDIVAVLAKVVQEQRKSISQLNKEVQVLQKNISQLKKEIIELKKSR